MFEITPVFIVAIVFGFTYGIIQLLVRRKERMALIEKGADPSLLVSKSNFNFYALKLDEFPDDLLRTAGHMHDPTVAKLD